MDSLRKLLDPNYLFEVYPGSDFRYSAFFLVFFGLMIVASFYWRRWRKKHPQRKSLQATLPFFENKLLTMGLVGWLFLGIRYENIPYFSMRFLFGLYLLCVVYVLGYSTYRYKKVLPEKNAEEEKKMERKKYSASIAKRKNKKKQRK